MKEKSIQITTKVTPSMYEELQKISAIEHKPMAEIMRNYIEQGMNISKAKADIDFIRRHIREELEGVIEPYMKRNNNLLIRIGTMTITMCFFTSKVLYVLLSKYENIDYKDMMKEAKKNAAAFLSRRDVTIEDTFNNIRLFDDDK